MWFKDFVGFREGGTPVTDHAPAQQQRQERERVGGDTAMEVGELIVLCETGQSFGNRKQVSICCVGYVYVCHVIPLITVKIT